jgi:hypothetical protein
MFRWRMRPGVVSFIAGAEYAHGGMSLQECLVPVLHLDVWLQRGQRHGHHQVSDLEGPALHGGGGWLVGRPDGGHPHEGGAGTSSSLASVKPLEAGKASLAVADDDTWAQRPWWWCWRRWRGAAEAGHHGGRN